ncbi:hypothetical protein [Ruania rhizosphaerae]|uniref:hypothetical protein n=1 Tax=Ruania rhizosphaerae TaxID=1840413 RepID=UPI00135C2348|nr:hypothetical protein [Ruania rhizosphaerae]
MPILEATYDPAWAAVRIVVDGGMWPSAVSQIRIERQSAGYPVIPVRGVEDLWVAGGYWIGTDHEMPINTNVQYTVYGFNEFGDPVAQESQSVSTVGAPPCDFFIKAPGKPDLTQNVIFRGIGDVSSATRGGAYQIHQSDPAARPKAIAQWAGSDTLQAPIIVGTKGAGAARALEGLLQRARVVLIQDAAAEPELTPGWYLVTGWSRANPAQMSYAHYDGRNYALSLVATDMPAGLGVRSTGTTWQGVMDQYATWQDVIDANPTWFDLLQGA